MKKLLFLLSVTTITAIDALNRKTDLQNQNHQGPVIITVLNNNQIEYWIGSAYIDDIAGHTIQRMENRGQQRPLNDWPLVAEDDNQFYDILDLLYPQQKKKIRR